MQTRLIDLVKRLAAAADRRRGMDPALLGQLDTTVAVLQQDHQVAGEDDDILGRLGEVYGLDSLDLDLLLIAVATDLDANIALAYGILRGGSGPARPSIGLALELAGVSSMSGQASGRLGASSELRRGALLDVSTTQPWLSRELSCPDRVIAHLQGNNTPEPDLAELLLDPVPLLLPGSRQVADALEGGVGLVWIHAPIGSAGICMAAGALARDRRPGPRGRGATRARTVDRSCESRSGRPPCRAGCCCWTARSGWPRRAAARWRCCRTPSSR